MRKEVGRERRNGGRVWLRFSLVPESSMTASNRPVFVHFETLHIFFLFLPVPKLCKKVCREVANHYFESDLFLNLFTKLVSSRLTELVQVVLESLTDMSIS